MKSLLRSAIIDAAALAALPHLLSGVDVHGGVWVYLLSGIVLTIMAFTVKPILTLLTLPLNLITLGMFSFITNAVIFYILALLVPQVSIHAFEFSGFVFAGFVVPHIFFNTFFAYVVSAFVFSAIISAIKWLID